MFVEPQIVIVIIVLLLRGIDIRIILNIHDVDSNDPRVGLSTYVKQKYNYYNNYMPITCKEVSIKNEIVLFEMSFVINKIVNSDGCSAQHASSFHIYE